MSILRNHSDGIVTRRLSLVFGILLFTINSCEIAAQTKSAGKDNSSGVEAHFAAAQQAQKNQDYITAEREYLAVLAVKPDFAEVHMNLGLVYQLQDQITEAMSEFRRALKLKPALTGANFFLGVDYCHQGEGAKAIFYFRAAARTEPNRANIWSWLATAQEMTGEVHAEIASIRQGLALQPQNIDLLYLLGHAYERLGKEEVTGLQKSGPGSARAEQLLAESYSASSEWPSAVIHFQNSLASAPDIRGVHVEMGELLLREGKPQRAALELEEELRQFPDSLRAIVRRGEVKLVTGDEAGALLDWARALETDAAQAERILGIRETESEEAPFDQLSPALRESMQQHKAELQKENTPAVHLALAFIATQNGDTAAATAEVSQISSRETSAPASHSCAEAEVRQSLKYEHLTNVKRCGVQVLTPTSPVNFRILVAGALFETGDYETSLEILSKLPPSDRHSPEAAYWRARGYEQLATAAYLKLYESDANSYRTHQLSGDLAAAKDDDGKAIEEYRAAIALKPALPNLHYSLGHVLWKDLKVDEARREFEAELKLNPRHPGALNELGDTYLLEHQPEKALPFLTQALAMDPANRDIHRDLGTAYSELRNFEKAASEFSIAVTDDHDGSVHYKLGRTYQALGEKEKAAREFALSTKLNQESHSKLEKQTERLGEIEKWVQGP